MSGSENVLRPSADLSREKTEAAIKATRQNSKTSGAGRSNNAGVSKTSANCDVVKKMESFENEVKNASPNASNINHG